MKQLAIILLAVTSLNAELTIEVSKPKWSSGVPVLDIQADGVDGRELLNEIGKKAEVNIWVSPHARFPEVSLNLHEVKWTQAVEYIAEAEGHTTVPDGNILRVATLQEIHVEPYDKRRFTLENRSVTEITDILEFHLETMGMEHARYVIDERLNHVWIYAQPSRMNQLQQIIEQLDLPYKWDGEKKETLIWSKKKKEWKTAEEYDENIDGTI